MLYKNKCTGKIVELIETIPDTPGTAGDSDRVYFKTYEPVERYCYADQWAKDYTCLGEGHLEPYSVVDEQSSTQKR